MSRDPTWMPTRQYRRIGEYADQILIYGLRLEVLAVKLQDASDNLRKQEMAEVFDEIQEVYHKFDVTRQSILRAFPYEVRRLRGYSDHFTRETAKYMAWLEGLEEVELDEDYDMEYVNGAVVCDACGKRYDEHPSVKVAHTVGPLLLTRVCDGTLVKL